MAARILLVDDSRSVVESLTRILSLEGYQVESYRDAESGLDRLATVVEQGAPIPDLVLLDLVMPGLGGLTVLRHIRSTDRLAHLPVVILSIEADPKTQAMVRREGATDFIPKPVDAFELLACVERLLN
jgi:DNA-binding response OmpR family regulator